MTTITRAAAPVGEARVPGRPVGRNALAVVAIVAGAVLSTRFSPAHVGGEALAFGLTWAGCLALLAANHRSGLQSPAGLYLAVFGIFHGGLIASVGLRGDAGLVVPIIASQWIHDATVPEAVRSSMLGAVSFTAAVLLVQRGSRRARPEPEAIDPRSGGEDPPDGPERSTRIGLVGLGVLFLGLSVVSLAIVAGGGLSGGYDTLFLSAQGNALFSYGMLFVGVGLVFSVIGTPAQRRLGLTAFGAFALVAVPLGLRGPVLFVAVTVLAVEVRRGLRIRLLVAVVGAVALLMVIGVVRQTRTEGPTAIVHGDWLAAPMDAVGEMGFSLYPVVVVTQWHDAGEPYRNGTTLTAVPVRFVDRVLGQPVPVDDNRLFNSEILTRVGGIGGSPVAEGFHNFGPLGVIGLLGGIGAVIGGLDRRIGRATDDARLGLVLLPLMIDVRNFFAVVPAQWFIGFVLLSIALLIPHRTRAQEAVARARPPVGPRPEPTG